MQNNLHLFNTTLDMAKTAAALIDSGKVVIIPTDTLYALAADGCNPEAVDAVYRVKQRSTESFFPMLVADLHMAAKYVKISELSQNLMDAFWPGGLTIALPALDDCGIAKNAYNKRDVAVRVPDNLFAREVIRLLGRPIVGTSANLSGGDDLKTAKELDEVFAGKVAGIFSHNDACAKGQSTIISVNNDKIQVIRKGAVLLDKFSQYIC